MGASGQLDSQRSSTRALPVLMTFTSVRQDLAVAAAARRGPALAAYNPLLGRVASEAARQETDEGDMPARVIEEV